MISNIINRFFQPKNDNQLSQHRGLNLEQLESRVMLSTVQIFAAGTTGQEELTVELGGAELETVTVAGDATARQFQEFRFDVDTDLQIEDITLRFSNDLYDPDNGIDRNLTIDRIVLDGVTFQTEDASVYSTGTFSGTSAVSGFGLGETLYGNGQFVFGRDPANARILRITADGQTGEEQFQAIVRGTTVGSFQAGTEALVFETVIDGDFTADQVLVEFTNDLYLPESGFDRNLRVDFIEVNGQRFQSESPTTFFNGHYAEGRGIIQGSGISTGITTEILHANGFFAYSSSASDTTPPTVVLEDVELITEPGIELAFVVGIFDDVQSQFSSGADSAFTIEGPSADLLFVRSRNGSQRPDGSLVQVFSIFKLTDNNFQLFDSSDNGLYRIFLNENSVQDAAGNFAPAQELGSFELNINDSLAQ